MGATHTKGAQTPAVKGVRRQALEAQNNDQAQEQPILQNKRQNGFTYKAQKRPNEINLKSTFLEVPYSHRLIYHYWEGAQMPQTHILQLPL